MYEYIMCRRNLFRLNNYLQDKRWVGGGGGADVLIFFSDELGLTKSQILV